MKTTGLLLSALAPAALFGAPAADRTITLAERLGKGWTNELVSFPFAAPDGAAPAALRVVGPGGPVPAQLSAGAPGQPARLWLLVPSLPPRASLVYTVSSAPQHDPPPATDLAISKKGDTVEIATASVAVRLPLGGKEAGAPLPLADVPGPLAAMRLGAGAWSGGSSLTGAAAVLSWKSELTDAGPVFARVRLTYMFADSNRVTLTATVAAGDTTVRWDLTSETDKPAAGFDWRLPPVPGVTKARMPKGYGQWAREDRALDLKPGPDPFAFLSPDSSVVNIFPDCPSDIRLAAASGGPSLALLSRDPGAWVDPVAPLTYGGMPVWTLDNIGTAWNAWKRKRIPVAYAPDGAVRLQTGFEKGARRWWTAAGAPVAGDELDRVNDRILDWPADPKRPHPRLFVGRDEFLDARARAESEPELKKALAASGDLWAARALIQVNTPPDQRKARETEEVVKLLRDQLNLLGRFDVMRRAIRVAALYDALIDSDLLSPADRTLFRAQMADLAYVMADPMCWSMERGYHSGNPNMSCSYTLSLGVLACALADHPAAPEWADRASRWLDKWLEDEVGPGGEWIPEGSHYGHVSLEPMIAYAVAAKRAGFRDFSGDPRLKKVILYFAQYHTPRDPQRRGLRLTGAYGRGISGSGMACFGVAARFYRESDPALSRRLQWLWQESGYPVAMEDSRLGGTEPIYEDRRLPAEAPAWASALFPNLGALLRAGFDTPNESYVNVMAAVQSTRNLDVWTPEVGAIDQWFGRGAPLSTCFTFYKYGYEERHELLRNGVRLARNWGAPGDSKAPFGHYTETRFGAFSALPGADYVRSEFVNTKPDDRDWFPPAVPAFPRVKAAAGTALDWTRQVLFVKDPEPAGPAWLLLRDTTAGGQPTAWQFWTLSEKIGSADQVRDADAFLADRPGTNNAPARELPLTGRYTALGQCGVDVEYFVASPAATPRHTLRYGGMSSLLKVPEHQDLLHLQLPGDGAYYVALFPRPRQEAPPAFTALDGGKLVKVAGAFGTDFALLAESNTAAGAEGISILGTAATVQRRPGLVVLSLGAPGEAKDGAVGLAASDGPAALRTEPALLTVTIPASPQPRTVTVTAPGTWRPAPKAPVEVGPTAGASRTITFPAGMTTVTLVGTP